MRPKIAILSVISSTAVMIGCSAPVRLTGYPGPNVGHESLEHCRTTGYGRVQVIGLLPPADTYEELGYMTIGQESTSELMYTSIEKQIEAARIRACQWGADAIVVIESKGDKKNTWGIISGLTFRDERESRIVAIRYRSTPPKTNHRSLPLEDEPPSLRTMPAAPSQAPVQVEQPSLDPADLLERADDAFRAERWDEALKLYTVLREVDPKNPLLANRIALCESRIVDQDPWREYQSWQAKMLERREYHLSVARQLAADGQPRASSAYLLLAFAGDWEWKEGRELLTNVLRNPVPCSDCCDVGAAFDDLDLQPTTIEKLKQDGVRLCEELLSGFLVVTASVQGAMVSVDGMAIGPSPTSAQRLGMGPHRITVRKESFDDASVDVLISPGDTADVHLELHPTAGTLVIDVSESGAQVEIDGKAVAISPVKPLSLKKGSHTIRARKPTFGEANATVSIVPGDTTKVVLRLVPEEGKLTVISNPGGASLYVDGRIRGQTPVAGMPIPSGVHRVDVKKLLFHGWTGRLGMKAGASDTVRVTLREKTRAEALMRSALLPGWGQRYRDRPLPGWAFTALQLAAVGAAAYGYAAYDNSLAAYEDAQKAYDSAISGHDALWNEVQRTHDSAKSDRSFYRATLSVAAALYALNLLDALVF